MLSRVLILSCLAFSFLPESGKSDEREAKPKGIYFAKKNYVPHPLPTFADTRDKLPKPIYDENPLYVQMYWKTWELAFRNFHEPQPGSGFVSQFIDAAFNENIFLWDSCFLTMFCNYAHPLVPGIETLDNFYAKQHDDGEICREINRATGKDYAQWVNRKGKDLHSLDPFNWGSRFDVRYVGRDVPKPAPQLTLDGLNHPIFAWAELESVRITGDRSRLAMVYQPLVKYYGALKKYLRQGNGLYMTDWASMDNSPRIPTLFGGGTAVDTSSEMAMFAQQMAEIATLLGKAEDASTFRSDSEELAGLINQKMWNAERKFYFDLTVDGKQGNVRTIAAYWTLIAGVASEDQANALAAELRNPDSFGRRHRVPTVPADEKGYNSVGFYWRGSVWSPTNTMIIRGLERYGNQDLANEIALEHLARVAEVFQSTGTVWENYSPDAATPGNPSKPDLVGWTGIPPILCFLEHAIGLKPDAPNNRLIWAIKSDKRCGCEQYRFGGYIVSLVATPDEAQPGNVAITVESDGAFDLHIQRQGLKSEFKIKAGDNHFILTSQ